MSMVTAGFGWRWGRGEPEAEKAGVLDFHLCPDEVAEVVVGPAVDAAHEQHAQVLALGEAEERVGARGLGGAEPGRVLRAGFLAGAETLVVVVLAVGAADRKEEFGALAAVPADALGRVDRAPGRFPEPIKRRLVAVKFAEVAEVQPVQGEDRGEDVRAVFAALHEVRALAELELGDLHALHRAEVVVGLGVGPADRLVGPRAVALAGAGLRGQGTS